MRPFTTFMDGAVFRGTTQRPGILEEGATELSTTETTPTPMPERRSATSPEKPTALSAEEPDVPATASGKPTTEPTRGSATSPTPQETDKKVTPQLDTNSFISPGNLSGASPFQVWAT